MPSLGPPPRSPRGGQLSFIRATLSNERNDTLSADGLKVDGSMLCQALTAQGAVILRGAHVGSQLGLDGATLSNEGGNALNADRLRVDGMFCRALTAQGKVGLLGAHVGLELNFNGASLRNEGGDALSADRLIVEGSMFCEEGFTAQGTIRLLGAHVGGQLSFIGATLANPDGSALILNEAKVTASLWLRFAAVPEGAVDLRSARVGALYDSEGTWALTLGLRGFTYDHLEADSDVSAKGRLRWLERDPGKYVPQPYEQLAAFYRRAGHEQDARRVAIEKQIRRRDGLSWPARVWSWCLGAAVGHGYRAWLAGAWLLALSVVGSVLFGFAHPEYFKATKTGSETTDFQPVLYTLDLILPVVNLHQDDARIAQGPAQWGALLTVAGWVLATAAVAALTGLLKRD